MVAPRAANRCVRAYSSVCSSNKVLSTFALNSSRFIFSTSGGGVIGLRGELAREPGFDPTRFKRRAGALPAAVVASSASAADGGGIELSHILPDITAKV